mgnify:CR=1 FL=1
MTGGARDQTQISRALSDPVHPRLQLSALSSKQLLKAQNLIGGEAEAGQGGHRGASWRGCMDVVREVRLRRARGLTCLIWKDSPCVESGCWSPGVRKSGTKNRHL